MPQNVRSVPIGAIEISDNPDDRGIAGASSGAICAFNAAWFRPDAFRRVLSTIGTYVGLRGGDEFPTLIPKFYSKEDIANGYIIGKDRTGEKTKIGLLAISIGVVDNSKRNITHIAQIGEIGVELKKYAKSFPDSNFVRDKRGEE